jgi:hypothetical protein
MGELRRGSCHCGAVVFEVELEKGITDLRRCACSICKRKGAVMAGVPLEKLKVVRGAEQLTLYQWKTKTAKHYFCRTCGIYTHHQRRSKPDEYGYNVACLEGVNPYELGEIPVSTGVTQSLEQVPTWL